MNIELNEAEVMLMVKALESYRRELNREAGAAGADTITARCVLIEAEQVNALRNRVRDL